MTPPSTASTHEAGDMGVPGSSPSACAALVLNLLGAAPVAMALTDDLGVIRWANRALGQLVQQPVDTLIGTSSAQLAGATGLEDGAGRDGSEQRWIRADGAVRWLSLQSAAAADSDGVPVTFNGRPCSIIQILDITDIKEIRAELERSHRELMQFAYVASHDLSEPLRVIAGHVDLLASRYRGQLDDDAERWIGFAVDGCIRMRELIGDMLDYSRYGPSHDEHRPVHLDDVVARARRTTFGEDHLPSPCIEVGDLPVVLGSASELERVFSNLLGNAAKFARPNVASRIAIHAARAGDDWQITVTDNGIGIPEEHRDRIFGLFQRLHPQEDYPGSGIGLAICRKIVERHRGRIWVEAAAEDGSRFCIELPVLVTHT